MPLIAIQGARLLLEKQKEDVTRRLDATKASLTSVEEREFQGAKKLRGTEEELSFKIEENQIMQDRCAWQFTQMTRRCRRSCRVNASRDRFSKIHSYVKARISRRGLSTAFRGGVERYFWVFNPTYTICQS